MDRRIPLPLLAAGTAALVVLAIVLLLFVTRSQGPGAGGPLATQPPGSTAGAVSTPDPSPVAIASAPIVAAQPPPAVPPEVSVIASPVAPAATKAPATPTPSPDPDLWRVEGVILDEATKLPLHQVCVVIGPHGCQRGSIRTDSRGVFAIDVPKNPSIVYDLYFVRDGYWTVWLRIKPTGPSVYNLALTAR